MELVHKRVVVPYQVHQEDTTEYEEQVMVSLQLVSSLRTEPEEMREQLHM